MRILLISLGLVVVAGTVWYKAVIEPSLTATRLELWVESQDDRVVIAVDGDDGLVFVSGGMGGLSELFVSNDFLYVRPKDVNLQSDDQWVRVPLAQVDERFTALLPDRVLSALPRGIKQCRRPDEDALAVMRLLLDAEPVIASGASLCGSDFDGAVDDVQLLIVGVTAVRPSQVPDAPTASVVELAATPTPQAVVAALDEIAMRITPE